MRKEKQSLNRKRRLDFIRREVIKHGNVSLYKLAENLNVSRMTIHRDLDELEKHGVLRKNRNGATAQPSGVFESNVAYRITRAVDAKKRLCAHAATLIETGDVILLDDATTLLPMIEHLKNKEDITVLSNFLPIQREVATLENVRLIGLCGEHIPQFDTFSGPICEQAVGQLKANIYFTSTTAIEDGAAFHPNLQVAGVKRAMMRASEKKFLLADVSKFNRSALSKFANLDEFDQIFIDAELSEPAKSRLQHLRKKLSLCPEG